MDRVQKHYDRNAQGEWDRLSRHRTELAVTLRVLDDHLPSPPASILDVGGGPGRYAIELAKRGYDVTLVDLSAQCLRLAREKALAADASIKHYLRADATDLGEIPSASFDAVLLMGPLYHLLSKSERDRAVVETMRALRVGGAIFASFISRFAPFRHSAAYDPAWVHGGMEYALDVLESGIHDQGTGFPDAYFAHPNEIGPLMEEHGAVTEIIVGCEGAVSMHEDSVNALVGAEWDAWVDLNYRIGCDPHAHGAAEHLLYVGRKAA